MRDLITKTMQLKIHECQLKEKIKKWIGLVPDIKIEQTRKVNQNIVRELMSKKLQLLSRF